MKIKKQTAGCSKQCFEVVDRTDEVSNHICGKVKLTWFEEIFEEYKHSDWIQKKALPELLGSGKAFSLFF